MFIKHMGHDVRTTVMGDLQTSKAQTSLCIRSDLEIYTKLHQTRPSTAVRSVGHDHFFCPKKVLPGPLFGPNMLVGLVICIQFLLDLKLIF